MSKDLPLSDSLTSRVSLDLYQEAANALMTSFIIKLETIVKELELNGGDVSLLKEETRSKLKSIEGALPKVLKDKVVAKIKSPEKDHESAVKSLDAKKQLDHETRHKKKEAGQAAMDFFRIFLPDMWVAVMDDVAQRSKEVSKASKIKEAKAAKDDTKTPSTEDKRSLDSKKPDEERAREHEQSYKLAHGKLMAIYNARLSNIKRAIELSGGDVTRLDPSVVAEIHSLQAILPEGHLKVLGAFMDGKKTSQETVKVLEQDKEKTAKELSGVVAGTILQCAVIIGEGSVSKLIGLVKPQPVTLTEISVSKPMTTPDVASKHSAHGFSVADMDAFSKRRSSE